MNFKAFYDKIIDLIYGNRRNIMKISFLTLALILLMIVFYFSSDNFNVNGEVNTLVNYIENRQYSMATTYYDGLEKEFSDSKMDRVNKKVAKKLSLILMNKGDMYINSQITKEQYMGLINIVNALNTIDVNTDNLIELGKRVVEMYKEENLSYDSALSYLQITSSLNDVDKRFDEYKQQIKVFYESREVYKEGTKNQSIKKYKEAIELYDKVIKDDEKYYSLAQSSKKECVKVMYDYYIDQAKDLAQEGRYENALKILSYLSPYYDDDKLNQLVEEYNKQIDDYTMTSEDIINVIARRSKENKKYLSVISYLQTVNGRRYYYAEVSKDKKIINEVLIDAESKAIYSYKSDKKDYNCDYSDAYFKIDENTSDIIFSIDEEKAQLILQEKFEKNQKKYSRINLMDSKKVEEYKSSSLKNIIQKDGDVYYYFTVKVGWFKPKEFYIVNMYNKNVYTFTQDKVSGF